MPKNLRKPRHSFSRPSKSPWKKVRFRQDKRSRAKSKKRLSNSFLQLRQFQRRNKVGDLQPLPEAIQFKVKMTTILKTRNFLYVTAKTKTTNLIKSRAQFK